MGNFKLEAAATSILATLLVFGSAASAQFTGTQATTPTPANQSDIKSDRRDLRNDKRDVRQDRRDIPNDKQDIRGDPKDGRQTQKDNNAEKKDKRHDRRDLRREQPRQEIGFCPNRRLPVSEFFVRSGKRVQGRWESICDGGPPPVPQVMTNSFAVLAC